MDYFYLNMPIQPFPEFAAMANLCIEKLAYTKKPGFAIVQRDFNTLDFVATSIVPTIDGFMRVALSRFW